MLQLVHIKKDYYVDKVPYHALKDISLAFLDKGFVSILGPSGCGKTTLLNIIGGLDHYTSGDLLIDGKTTKSFNDAEWDAYRNERVGFVFQSYNLIPHQTILSNVETGLMLNGVGRAKRQEMAIEALEKVGLKDAYKKRPNQLSGGQMQRVALARALVNNPRIVLADEPTGALDSTTSKQVMDLLKEASKTRLVIMVTHNQELATLYSDRIIRMKDGEVESDSVPVSLEEVKGEQKEINKKTSMSFATALKSSWANIRTKKARTILTAVASSIGIIGVALVLAVSNGFSLYVDKVEGSVAGAVPISITPVSYSYKAPDDSYEIYPDEKEVKVYDSSKELTSVHQNKFTEDYFKYLEKTVEKGWASSILYNRQNLSFNLLTKDPSDIDGKTIKSVNQYRSAGTMAGALSSVTSLPTTIFHELYGSPEEMSKWYDCIEGRMPENKDEIVLITDRYNRIEKSTLVNLGILSNTSQAKTISFDDILYKSPSNPGKIYKVYRNADVYKNQDYLEFDVPSYQIDTNFPSADQLQDFNIDDFKFSGTEKTTKVHLFASRPDNEELFNNDTKYNSVNLKIVGVLRSREDSYISLMPSSLGYLSSLKDYLADDGQTIDASEETILTHNRLLEAAKGNVYFPVSEDETKDGLAKLNKLLQTTIEEGDLKEIINRYKESKTLSEEDSSALTKSVNSFLTGLGNCLSYVSYYGTQKDGKQYLYYATSCSSYLTLCQNIGCDLLQGSIDIDSATGFAEMVIRMSEPSFWNDVSNADRTDWCLIDLLAFKNNFSIITSILIFPSSLTTKENLTAYLDNYNTGKMDADQILYSDVMGTFTSSLGVLIQVISVVLVVFASISLVVSSIMTGIITYVSVVERTKEIGILRACGARKKDVGRLFEAECVIVGAMAGVIGVGVSWIACFPISAIIDHMYPGNGLESIATLSPWAALTLIAIAIVLAFISGLIPARIAAKKDPVAALRTE